MHPANPTSLRKLLLAVHVGATVSVLGMDLAILALGIRGWSGMDPLTVYPAAHLIAAWLIAPLAVVSLGTGVLLGLTTPWGLFQYWWVTIKLAITLALTGAVLFVLVPRLQLLAATAGSHLLSNAERLPIVIAPGVASALLLLALALAVFKPRWRLRAGPAQAAQVGKR